MTMETIPQGKSTCDIQAELNTRLYRLESLLKMSFSEHGIESFESLDMGQKLAITGSFIESVTKCLELSDSIESA